jgi:hypothetical protein
MVSLEHSFFCCLRQVVPIITYTVDRFQWSQRTGQDFIPVSQIPLLDHVVAQKCLT